MDKWSNRRPTYCCTNRWISRLADGQMTDRLLDRKTGEWKDKIQRQIDRKTNCWIETQTERVTQRQTNGLTDTTTKRSERLIRDKYVEEQRRQKYRRTDRLITSNFFIEFFNFKPKRSIPRRSATAKQHRKNVIPVTKEGNNCRRNKGLLALSRNG
jgi:hypothetical protein